MNFFSPRGVFRLSLCYYAILFHPIDCLNVNFVLFLILVFFASLQFSIVSCMPENENEQRRREKKRKYNKNIKKKNKKIEHKTQKRDREKSLEAEISCISFSLPFLTTIPFRSKRIDFHFLCNKHFSCFRFPYLYRQS